MKGEAAMPPPTINPNMALEMLLRSTTCRDGNHCWVRNARAGWRAMTVMPKATRPRINTAKPGDRAWASRNNVPSIMVTVVRILGANRDAHQPTGMARVRLPQ